MAGDLILVLGDQLTPRLSALRKARKGRDLVLMAEVAEEATYVRHHKKKIAFLFSAMRHFSDELRDAGWDVEYVRLDSDANTGSLGGEVGRAVRRHGSGRVLVTEPGEWRLLQDMRGWQERLSVPVEILPDDRFLVSKEEFAAWADGRKQFRMEHFYRGMRRRTGLLMEGDAPCGGCWNFDAENRKPAAPDLFMPEPHREEPDRTTGEVLDLVEERFADHFGDLRPFWFAVTRAGAEAALAHFISVALPRFGDFQDAMLRGRKFLYHAVVSQYINAGLLDPLEVCRKVEAAYAAGEVPLNAAEGFIRQVIGWREYVRGIYWLKMPDYADMNFFGAARPLPEFYWTGKTDMACLAAAIGQTREEAYAHHIQRLMVTGNFAMLAGIEPRAVHEWYLAVYADAYEWVELPNTLGMSQFADGGLLGSKPYAAGGNYMNRMSDYCGTCRFDVKRKTGAGACPFNALYWDFLVRNRALIGDNPRLGQVYRTWDRMAEEKRAAYRESAAVFLSGLR
ncbi:cryptochrome/photolyase family protein [Nisaea sp.]|uniref:cryptochrome/photolyase family protein n=1 Tax=Nisaea sp. TaxID=2024842 RepID=UPI0032EF612A